MIRIGRGALLCCLLAAACGHVSGYSAKLQPDGSYRIDCTNHLTRCLNAIEEVCAQGYEIVQAHEDVRYAGPREFNEASISSVVADIAAYSSRAEPIRVIASRTMPHAVIRTALTVIM